MRTITRYSSLLSILSTLCYIFNFSYLFYLPTIGIKKYINVYYFLVVIQNVAQNHAKCLVRVSKASHARHDAENVVVGSIDANSRGQVGADGVVRDSQEQRGVVNARQVARARRLVLLRLEGKRVNVDADSGDVGVVLVRLNQVEVVAVANLEAVVAVELEERGDDRVLASHALDTGDRVARLEHGAVPPVRVVERLLSLPRVDDGVIARHVRVTLDDPDELLARVVEVELQLVGR